MVPSCWLVALLNVGHNCIAQLGLAGVIPCGDLSDNLAESHRSVVTFCQEVVALQAVLPASRTCFFVIH